MKFIETEEHSEALAALALLEDAESPAQSNAERIEQEAVKAMAKVWGRRGEELLENREAIVIGGPLLLIMSLGSASTFVVHGSPEIAALSLVSFSALGYLVNKARLLYLWGRNPETKFLRALKSYDPDLFKKAERRFVDASRDRLTEKELNRLKRKERRAIRRIARDRALHVSQLEKRQLNPKIEGALVIENYLEDLKPELESLRS